MSPILPLSTRELSGRKYQILFLQVEVLSDDQESAKLLV
jgi:hypothetical protein